MIFKGKNELQARYYGKKVVTYVYIGTKLIWQSISSCFGAGYWRNEFPWKNGDVWQN